MNNQIFDFYLTKEDPSKSCLLALRDTILSHSQISESIKYGMPCFTYKSKALCYLWIEKRTARPYMLIVDGKLIDHPALEKGNRNKMKVLFIDPNKDLPIEIINDLIKMAIQLRIN